MLLADVRFVFAFDRWASRRILEAAAGIDEATWSARNVVDERGLGGILVHQLGSTQRWRHGLSGSAEQPRPEKGPLLSVEALRAAFEEEWAAYEAWFATLDDDAMLTLEDGVPVWTLLLHVVNHGTQHRSEAAALLTEAGHSPGDLDLVDFAELRATGAA